MSLETVLKEIQVYKPQAEANLENIPDATLNAHRGRKNQAIEQMKVLKGQYRESLLKSAVFIVVAGALRKDFSDIATNEKFKLFSADPEQFYEDLAGRVPQSLYLGKEGVSNIFDVLGRHLEDKMGELDAVGYNQLIFKEKYIKPITTKEQFTAIVKEAINDQIGTEIVAIQASESILNDAIERGHAAKTTSIVLSTTDEKLTLDMLKDLGKRGNKIVLVLAGKASKALNSFTNPKVDVIKVKEANELTVQETLDKIKSSLKNSNLQQ